ncbi:hypothetical protein PM085_21050, partial [Halorubrum ezzemoulense]|nr:hypothetical protein [Halorubrum ezzemoulense]
MEIDSFDGDSNAVVVVTYQLDGETIVAGVNDSTALSSGSDTVSVELDSSTPGTHTAHLFDAVPTDRDGDSLGAGDSLGEVDPS